MWSLNFINLAKIINFYIDEKNIFIIHSPGYSTLNFM